MNEEQDLVLDEAAMMQFIVKRTGLSLEVVQEVMNAEMEYMVHIGLAAPIEDQ